MPGKKTVVIIGGGVVGLCAAYYLWKRGAEVTLLEKHDIGYGSSSDNAGLVTPSHFVPLASPGVISQGLKWLLDPVSPFYIKPRLDFDLLSWLWKFRAAANERQMRRAMPLLRDLSVASLTLYEEITGVERLEYGFERRGLVMLFNSDAGRRANVHEAELAREIGVDARLLTRRELEHLEPGATFAATGGVYFPGDAHLSPATFMSAMSSFLRSRGVQLQTETDVLGLESNNTHIENLRTTHGALQADEYVLAAGSWSPGLLRNIGIRLPLQPGKGYSVTIPNPNLKLKIPSILTEARVAVTPMGNRLRLAGTMELAGLDQSVNMRRVEAIINAVPRYYGGFDPSTVDRSHPWKGLRPCSPDGLPYIGRFRAYSNLTAATGHAMVGMSLGPITGKLVAELIYGQPTSIDISSLSPDRYS
jgi:D-amino-acid dehydrogenase